MTSILWPSLDLLGHPQSYANQCLRENRTLAGRLTAAIAPSREELSARLSGDRTIWSVSIAGPAFRDSRVGEWPKPASRGTAILGQGAATTASSFALRFTFFCGCLAFLRACIRVFTVFAFIFTLRLFGCTLVLTTCGLSSGRTTAKAEGNQT